ncbi:MAG: hypothetical protein ACJ74U_00960 [Jatrophihabitantaceae bacterium]
MSEPPSPATGEYRVADLEVFYAGTDLALVHSRDTGAAGFYRPEIVELLTGLRDFRGIDDHLRNCLRDRPELPAGVLHRELVNLCRAGFLVPRDQPSAGGPVTEAQPITTVGFPTRDRVELLGRAVTGYTENCSTYGRRPAFVVLDDSAEQATRDRYRTMLAELAERCRVEIGYAGLPEKSAFVTALAETGGVPPAVARYACLGERRADIPTVGANRNCLLLHTVGERIFSADDDTVCQLALPPEQGEQLALRSAGNPLQTWYFTGRDEAFESLPATEQDLLGAHERYLGRSPAEVLAGVGARASWELAEPALLRRLRSRPGRILLTSNGTVGDCGWDNPNFQLFAEGSSFSRLTQSAAGYRQLRGSRELAQAVTQPTITAHPDPRFAMCIGLDNTELLAPFPPTGRAEEVSFGAILARCFRDGYGAHLPLLARHDPAGERQFSNESMFAINFGSWLPACIGQFDPGASTDPPDRLRGLGNYLADLGRLPAQEFDSYVRDIVWQSMSALISGLTERLTGADSVPDFWAADARRFIATARRQALAPVAELCAAVGGRSGLQRSLVQFGELLTWWPRLVAAAATLRASGIRLAGSVAS